MHVLTRQELFEAAWDRPLTQVAAELGVTSTALKKTCSRHHIPTPGRGYWAAVQANGNIYQRPKLPPAHKPELETVRIVGATPLPAPVRAAQAEAKAKVSARAERPSATEEDSAPPEPSSTGESPSEHPILAATRKALSRAKADSIGFVQVSGQGVMACTLAEASVERALALLSGLFKAAERQGHTPRRAEHGVVLLVDEEALSFHLEEKPTRTPHRPTPKELAEKAKRMGWGYCADPWPKYDHSPSGELSLVIDSNSYSGLRRTYSDGKHQPLEAKLEDVLVAFAGHAAFAKERRREAEENRRKAALAEARRLRIQAFRQREERRSKFVDAVAAELDERSKLAAVLAHLECAGSAEYKSLADLGAWVRRRLQEIDALLSVKFLDLSVRHSQVDFDEAQAAQADEPSSYFPRAVELNFWSIDAEQGHARSQSALEWALEAGLLPALEAAVRAKQADQ